MDERHWSMHYSIVQDGQGLGERCWFWHLEHSKVRPYCWGSDGRSHCEPAAKYSLTQRRLACFYASRSGQIPRSCCPHSERDHGKSCECFVGAATKAGADAAR